MDVYTYLNLFILFYLLFCFSYHQYFNVKIIRPLILRLGLDHSWPMFVDPVLHNYKIHCLLHFKDGTNKTFEFSDSKSGSLIHRKYIDSLISQDYLHGALSDYIINFSGIENISEVSVKISKTPIKDYNNSWKTYRKEMEDYD
jgi:hypothetical protein